MDQSACSYLLSYLLMLATDATPLPLSKYAHNFSHTYCPPLSNALLMIYMNFAFVMSASGLTENKNQNRYALRSLFLK